jgi:hypothetical protein
MKRIHGMNRRLIIDYLNNVLEDDFIFDVIIPLMAHSGYSVYQHPQHGPGEHGKDIVFYRDVRLFCEHEYIAVQAKAEKTNTSNVQKFADQMKRALNVSFKSKSKGSIKANYALFINARIHTNDIQKEFPELTDSPNIKILSQENVADLMLEYGILPDPVKKNFDFEEGSESTESIIKQYNEELQSILLGNDEVTITKLLDVDLRSDNRPVNEDTRYKIIGFVNAEWDKDGSWEGIARPMKWLNQYFEYIQPSQGAVLLRVIKEHLGTWPSRKAAPDTKGVLSKITPKQLSEVEEDFFRIVSEKLSNGGNFNNHPLILQIVNEYLDSEITKIENIKIKNSIKKCLELTERIKNADTDDLKTFLQKERAESIKNLRKWLNPDEEEYF